MSTIRTAKHFISTVKVSATYSHTASACSRSLHLSSSLVSRLLLGLRQHLEVSCLVRAVRPHLNDEVRRRAADGHLVPER